MSVNFVFLNGQVITVDQQFTVAEALAVSGNKIEAVGSNEEILALKGEDTEIIDLKGRSLLPGFIDAHAHLELYGTNCLGVNCKEVASIEEIKEMLRQSVSNTPEGKWVRGWGYNQNHILEGRHLTRWDLDEVSTEHPIIVVRTCGHISCVNSKALEIAGINETTEDPPGGRYVRQDGELTGLLLEEAHMNLFLHAQYSEDEILKGLKLASEAYMSKGITSVHDAGGYGNDHFRYLYQAVKTGHLKTRVYALYGSLNDSPQVVTKGLQAGLVTGVGDEKFRIGPAKVFIDGSSSGPTARTRLPYTSNPNDSGILYLNQEELNRALESAHQHGWQITAHAIGDEAVEMMINCIENAMKKYPRQNCRHRIEHAGMTPPDLVKRMKSLNIVPIPNPAFIFEFGDGYIKDYGDRVNHMFPIQSFVELEIPAAIGSDSPITDFNPMVGIQAALTRKSKGGAEIGSSQTIYLEDAIRAYTWNGAYASFEESKKGSLEKGKLADLIILDRALLSAPIDTIHQIEVDLTIIDGKVVFEKQKEGTVQ